MLQRLRRKQKNNLPIMNYYEHIAVASIPKKVVVFLSVKNRPKYSQCELSESD